MGRLVAQSGDHRQTALVLARDPAAARLGVLPQIAQPDEGFGQAGGPTGLDP